MLLITCHRAYNTCKDWEDID